MKFIVHRTASKQYRWKAVNHYNGQVLANNAESHPSRAHTIRKAKEMAAGRPVYLKDWRTGKLISLDGPQPRRK
jgi:hypothetical protein